MDRNIGLRQIRIVLFGILFTLVVLAPFSVLLAESKSTYHGISSAISAPAKLNVSSISPFAPVQLFHANAPSNTTNKVVILTFGDTKESQFTNAKPILDQYGFKASFFITCNDVNGKRYHLNWDQILALQKDGQDIESKGMTPINLNNLSSSALSYQIGGSKQCLESHGVKSPNWFAAKYGHAWDNATVINAISRYYQFTDNGLANLMYLNCDGYPNSNQTDCKTYNDNGKLNFANAYSVREWSHNHLDKEYQHNDTIIFQKFVKEVNSGIRFNNNKGIVDAIPVVAYHIVDNSLDPQSTDLNLFAAEMKYLHDNHFDVIPMSDLGYDQNTNHIYIK